MRGSAPASVRGALPGVAFAETLVEENDGTRAKIMPARYVGVLPRNDYDLP